MCPSGRASTSVAPAVSAPYTSSAKASKLVETVRKTIESEPLARLDYVQAVDSETLELIETIGDREIILATAVFFGQTRLIDNIRLNRKQ